MLFLLLSGAIFGACSSDKDRVLVFVKNVVMPPDSWVFAPGDGVTVSAEGFEADDEIMLEIHWQESAEGFAPEGYAKGVRGIVTVRSATSVTFLAPGHYPASTVRVLLLRRGIACAVGLPGSGWIYGVCSGSMAGFDLTMNYYDDFGYRNSLLAGHISDSSVGLISHDAGRLTLTTRSATRSPSPAPVSWQVPDEVVQTLAVQPFVRVGSDLLLAQRNADGTCAPLVLRVYGGAGPGEAVGADAMIPFWTVVASADEPDRMVQAGGYAVSAGGKTQLRLFNAAGDGAFGETLAEVPGTALSVTEYAPDKDSLEIYLLCEADGMRRIHVYDALKKTQRTLPGEFGCSEIVMAK